MGGEGAGHEVEKTRRIFRDRQQSSRTAITRIGEAAQLFSKPLRRSGPSRFRGCDSQPRPRGKSRECRGGRRTGGPSKLALVHGLLSGGQQSFKNVFPCRDPIV